MEGLFTLLLFAGIFYIMMRFGCGAHMVHGGHGGHGGHGHHADPNSGSDPAPAGTARDPVCGMDVGPGQGYARFFEGQEYRLCSRTCLDKFDANPGTFVKTQGRST